MTPKIIITVAPVGHFNPDEKLPVKNPLTPEDIANDVIRSYNEGASQVHLHVRDLKGEATFDLSVYSKTLDLIREKSDIIIQGSTGGLSDLSLDERCVSLNEKRTEVATLNMGSVNFFHDSVYINTIPDIRYWSKKMKEKNICAECEIFDLSMIGNVSKIIDEGLIPPAFYYNLNLGFEGALDANAKNLGLLKEALPEGAIWGYTQNSMEDFSLLITALTMGAKLIRVGFEDSIYYTPGKIAESNSVLVNKIVNLAKELGYEIASPSEARELLGINQDKKIAGYDKIAKQQLSE